MKIVFLCGSLEPGCDGVGDYTLRLTGELFRLGHQVAAVALNDSHISEPVNGCQCLGEIELSILRLPSAWPLKLRFEDTKQWIEEFNPEWLSLQYVPFSFQEKGLPFGFNKFLKELGHGRHWQIMFHELWVGVERTNFIKSFIKNIIQKFIIKQLIHLLHPVVIHTHLPYYKLELEKIGLQICTLPLFSNIEVSSGNQQRSESNVLTVGVFSQAEISYPIIKFLKDLEKHTISLGQSLAILLIGGGKSRMKAFKCELEKILNLRSKVRIMGHLEAKKISETLQTCTIGLTPVPRHALGKSGSVAAFITHGIPVAAPNVHSNYDSDMIGFFSQGLSEIVLLEPDLNKINKAKEKVLKVKNEIELSTIANKFLSDLKSY